MSDLEVKCVRCGAAVGFGDFASSDPEDRRERIAALAVGVMGWRQTFAGMQCPNHPVAGHMPTPTGMESFSDHPDAAQGMPREATRRECGSGASAPASPVLEEDAPNSAPNPGISGEDE